MAGENKKTTNARGRQIRIGQKAAARALARRMDEASARLREIYEQALADLQRDLEVLANAEGKIPIDRLPAAERLVRQRLGALSQQRDSFLRSELAQAVGLSSSAWSTAGSNVGVDYAGIGQEVLGWLDEFQDANGLQLSDRLWRIDRGARERVMTAIESAVVQGHSAGQAARHLITNGQHVPQDLLTKEGLAAVRNIQRRTGDALLTGKMNPYLQAERVFRTEMNRGFGEAAVRAAAQHPDVIAVRFVLSPLHPRPDICDMHAKANRHGLGPGVYPIDNHPWPAHPNTLSYLEPIFRDEITDEDRAGRESMTDFINKQPAENQDAILGGQAKGWAWRSGHLDPRQIEQPWRKIVPKLQRKGIDIPERYAP